MQAAAVFLLITTLALCAVMIMLYYRRDTNIESFLVTMQEYVLPSQCPDYAVYDGHNYYLIYNNRPFDGKQNPLVYASEQEMRQALNDLKCPFADRMPIEFLRRTRNRRDPQESYDRLCNKRISAPNYALNKCASTFGLGGNVSDSGTPNPINPIHSNDFAAAKNDNESDIKTDGVPFKGDKLAMLHQLSQFLDQASSDIMADYDQETCMIYEMTRDQPQLGNPEHLLKYAQAFQTGHVDGVRSAHGGTGAPPPLLGNHLLEATDGAFPGAFLPDNYV